VELAYSVFLQKPDCENYLRRGAFIHPQYSTFIHICHRLAFSVSSRSNNFIFSRINQTCETFSHTLSFLSYATKPLIIDGTRFIRHYKVNNVYNMTSKSRHYVPKFVRWPRGSPKGLTYVVMLQVELGH